MAFFWAVACCSVCYDIDENLTREKFAQIVDQQRARHGSGSPNRRTGRSRFWTLWRVS